MARSLRERSGRWPVCGAERQSDGAIIFSISPADSSLFRARLRPELLRRAAGFPSKQRAERTQALESDVETHFRHRLIRLRQRPPRPVHPSSHRVTTRRLSKCASKKPVQVIRRKAGSARDRLKIQRFAERCLQYGTRACQGSKQLHARRCPSRGNARLGVLKLRTKAKRLAGGHADDALHVLQSGLRTRLRRQ